MISPLSLTKLVTTLFIPMLLGLGLTVSTMAGLASAEGHVDQAEPAAEPPDSDQPEPVQPMPEVAYARIITDHAPVYHAPAHASAGLSPTRLITPGFIWVTLETQEPISYNNELWYHINPDEYVRADHVSLYTPSTFQGLRLTSPPEYPFGWVVRETPVLAAPGSAPTTSTQQLAQYDRVTIYETKWLDGVGWHRIGPKTWVELYDVGAVRPAQRPAEIGPEERWIEVDLFEQTLAAYEGDRMIYATLISSGLPGWNTPEGLFRIKSKVRNAKMSGGGKIDYYFIEDVQATMYFTESYSLHAAYWHDSFGKFKSHGCVNMSPLDAQWLFEWTTPVASMENKTKASEEDQGTWVWIHE